MLKKLQVMIFTLVFMLVPALGAVNHWTSDGPFGGYISCMAISEFQPDLMIVGTLGKGVYRSVDGGASWRYVFNPSEGWPLFQYNFALSLHILNHTPDRVLLGTTKSVYLSPDGGLSWVVSAQGLPLDTSVNCFTQPDREGGPILAGTSGQGVYRSQDGGQTWTGSNTGLTAVNGYLLEADPADATQARVYAGTENGLYRSDDAGLSWQQVLPSYSKCVGLHVDALGTVYVSTLDGFYRSVNAGESWETVGGLFCPDISCIHTDPSHSEVLFVGSPVCGLNRSLDHGAAWTEISHPGLDSQLMLLESSPDGRKLFAGTQSGGLAYSEDGGTSWQPSFEGGSKNNVNCLLYVPERGGLYAGTAGGVFFQQSPGAPWVVARSGISVNSLASTGGANPVLFAGTEDDGVQKSTDGGVTWTHVTPTLPLRCLDVVVPPDAPGTVYAALYGYGVIRSLDGGLSWEDRNEGLTDLLLFSLVGEPNHAGTLYAGCRNGLFRTTDGGEHWTMILSAPDGRIRAVLTDPGLPGVIFAGTGYNLWKSTDNGASWQESDAGMKAPIIFSLYRRPATGELFAGSAGLYRSVDGGDHWIPYDPGFTGPALCLRDDPFQADTLLAGAAGVWSFKPSLDVDADGLVNANDVNCLSNFLNGSLFDLPAGSWAGDINLDGRVDLLDRLALSNAIAKR